MFSTCLPSHVSTSFTPNTPLFHFSRIILTTQGFLFLHLFQLSHEDLSLLQLSSGKFTSTSGIMATDAEKYSATAGTGNTAMPVGAAAGHQKTGMFGRKGRFDANAPGMTVHTNEPRTSQATAVSSG